MYVCNQGPGCWNNYNDVVMFEIEVKNDAIVI